MKYLVACLCASVAAPAMATSFTVTNVAMDTSPSIVHVNDTATGGTANEDAYMAPVELTTSIGSFVAWCIDLDHAITIGAQNLSYTYESMQTYLSSLPAYSAASYHQVAGIVRYEGSQPHGPGINVGQGAIWQMLFPGSVTSASDPNLGLEMAAVYAQATPASFDDFAVLVPNLAVNTTPGDVGQAFLVDVAPVPEAATWMMMLAGFCSIGAALRRRRTSVTFA